MTRPRSGRATAVLALAALLATGCGRRDDPGASPRRFLWVTRWDTRTEEDVRRLVGAAADLGFDALFFQVRGAASTLYPSRLEPRAPELAGAPPDYDPLAVAVAAAHAHGLELHAWVNVMPSWWGTTPPTDPQHVYNRHPEWHWYDQHGRRQALSEGFYVSLNPCLPAVRDHLVAVVEELLSRYDLDGLHLDYIRFPDEPPATPAGSDSDWPRDPATLDLYRTDTGLAPDDDPAAWDRWRAAQVTVLVRAIRDARDRVAPDVCLSAAVGADPERALAEHHQDVEGWIRAGLLDLVVPMNYTADEARFAGRLDGWEARARAVPVAMGVMASGDPALRRRELTLAVARFGAISVFAAHELLDTRNEVLASQDADARAARTERRRVLLGTWPSRVVEAAAPVDPPRSR